MLDVARTLSASTSVHALTGSSRPGAVPPLVPLGATMAIQPACGHDGVTTSGHVDAEVIALAGRVKRLAERLTANAEQVSSLSQQVRDEHPSVMNTLGRSATQEEFKARVAEVRAAEEQIGLPRLLKARRRMSARLVRWTGQLVAVEPRSLDGLGAKAETVSPVQEAQQGDLLADDLVEAVERDTVRLTGSSATAGANPALLVLDDEFRRLRRAVRSMEVASKGRDVDEMPGWEGTCARLDEIVGALCAMPAESVADLVVMARVVQTRWVQDHHTFASDLGFNFAEDVLRLLGSEVFQSSAAPQDRILDLRRQADAFRATGNAAADQASADRALEQETAAQERAVASPPRTVAGAITALEWAWADLLDYAVQLPDDGGRFRIAMLDGALGVLRRIATLPSTKPHPDADLLALAPAWAASAARCDATTADLDGATDRLRASTIPVPEALFWTEQDHRRAKPYGTEHVATGRRWFGEASSIEALRQGHPKELAEERRREIIEAYEGWQGEKLAAGETTGYVAAREADEEAGAENRTLRRRILAMPARTLDGILLKARVARWCFMDDEDEIARHLAAEAKDSAAAGETMAFSILLDLARMVGSAPAAVPLPAATSNIRPVPLPADLSALRLGADAASDTREWYRSWLYGELRMLNLEMDGSPDISAIPQDNPGAEFHFPREMSWRDVPQPSTRAAAVLGLLGLMPESADAAVSLPTASAA